MSQTNVHNNESRVELYQILERVINAERVIIDNLNSVSTRLIRVQNAMDDFRDRLQSLESDMDSIISGQHHVTAPSAPPNAIVVERLLAEDVDADTPIYHSYLGDVFTNSSLHFVGSHDATMASATANATCSICLSTLNDSMVRSMHFCRHQFHAHCIEEWALQHNTCPLCRCSFSTER